MSAWAPAPGREADIYTAALRLFREKGYHATSMQDIGAAVGLNKGSLYHHIQSKEQLLARAFEHALGALLAEIEPIASDDQVSSVEQLRRVIVAHIRAATQNLDALTVYFREWHSLDGPVLERAAARRDRYVRLVAGVLERGIRRGELTATDVSVATQGILGMCNGLCLWYRPDGRLAPDAIADVFARMVVRGLAAGRAPAADLGEPLARPF